MAMTTNINYLMRLIIVISSIYLRKLNRKLSERVCVWQQTFVPTSNDIHIHLNLMQYNTHTYESDSENDKAKFSANHQNPTKFVGELLQMTNKNFSWKNNAVYLFVGCHFWIENSTRTSCFHQASLFVHVVYVRIFIFVIDSRTIFLRFLLSFWLLVIRVWISA